MIEEHLRIGSNHLKKLKAGDMTLEEYGTEMAYWFISVLNKITYKPLPTKTQAIIDFEEKLQNMKNKTKYSKHKMDEEEFYNNFMRREVELYYEDREKINNINKSNLYWLIEFRNLLPQDDTVNCDRIENKIIEFREMLYEY